MNAWGTQMAKLETHPSKLKTCMMCPVVRQLDPIEIVLRDPRDMKEIVSWERRICQKHKRDPRLQDLITRATNAALERMLEMPADGNHRLEYRISSKPAKRNQR